MNHLMTNTNYVFVLFAVLALMYGYRVDLWRDNKKAKYIFTYFAIAGVICSLPNFTNVTFIQACIASKLVGILFMAWVFIHILAKREKEVLNNV